MAKKTTETETIATVETKKFLIKNMSLQNSVDLALNV